jgi:hypothetical protein
MDSATIVRVGDAITAINGETDRSRMKDALARVPMILELKLTDGNIGNDKSRQDDEENCHS